MRACKDGSALVLKVCSALGERGGEARSGDLIAVVVSSPPSPILCWGNLTQIKYYFLVHHKANKSHHTPLAWLPVRSDHMHSPAHARRWIQWIQPKNATINYVIAPTHNGYKKTTKRQSSVHVQLNITCTDDRQYYD